MTRKRFSDGCGYSDVIRGFATSPPPENLPMCDLMAHYIDGSMVASAGLKGDAVELCLSGGGISLTRSFSKQEFRRFAEAVSASADLAERRLS